MNTWVKSWMWRVLLVAIVGCAIAINAGGGPQPAKATKARVPVDEPIVDRAPVRATRNLPNVVFIYTDDQDEGTFRRRFMPKTFRLLVDRGTLFSDSVTATPLCCPSRVSYLTGQYPHSSGVFSNHLGYPALEDPESTLASWMQRAGYRTAWFGKYLQKYDKYRDPETPAPGVDEWAVTLTASYFRYTLFGDGLQTERGDRPRDYLTDVLTRKAVRLVKRSKGPGRPLYLTLNYLAPHGGKALSSPTRCDALALPAPRDLGRYRDLKLPRPPSFAEEDTSDKRAYPKDKRLGNAVVRKLTVAHQCRVASLRAVDRGVGRIFDAVKRAGEIDRTVFVMTSDNGYLEGQHRLRGKGIPYEEGIGVPLAMRVPSRYLGSDRVARVDELVANIDLAPTILDLARTAPCVAPEACRRLDGRSLAPLIAGQPGNWPGDRALLIEGGGENEPRCDYRGVRTTATVLIERTKPAPDGEGCVSASEPELYDLERDPFQLSNLTVTDAEASSDLLADLGARLRSLERCSGIEGRDPGSDAPFCE